jgi:hypothetical protein
MILKIKMPTHTAFCGWRLIDKVTRIDWEFVDKTPELRKHAEDACFMWINSDKPNETRKKTAEVHIVFEDNDRHEMFYTDNMVFIMNNNGKTCDTINV